VLSQKEDAEGARRRQSKEEKVGETKRKRQKGKYRGDQVETKTKR
jgi:hypothetical protein